MAGVEPDAVIPYPVVTLDDLLAAASEPAVRIPAVEEYSTIAARLREIEAEKQAALERVGE